MSTIQRQIDLAAVLAAVVQTSGTVAGRVRLQKTCYLLKQSGVSELKDLWFRYHHYGPFSDDVASVLQQSAMSGILSENAQDFADEWQRFEYKPGTLAEQYAQRLSAESKKVVADIVAKTKDESWRTLELAATIDYLQREERLAQTAALTRALQLKPACARYKDQAVTLLGAIGIPAA